MTVATTTNKASFACNGSTVAFPLTFPFYSKTDLVVTLRINTTGSETTLTVDVDYTVSVSSPGPGGTVTLIGSYATTPPATGKTLVVSRILPYTQEVDFIQGDALPPENLEEGLDRGVMLAQQLHDEIGRSMKAPVSDDESISLVLPTSAARAGRMMAFDDTGAVALGPLVSGEVIVGVSDGAYGPSWDGEIAMAPSKNAVYGQIKSMLDNPAVMVTPSAISGTDTYTGAFSPAITSYSASVIYAGKITNTNTTTTPTINFNSVGAKTIKKLGGTNLSSGDICAGMMALFIYDGTYMNLLNPASPMSYYPRNYGLSGGVASNAITISRTNGGSAVVSSDNPAYIPFMRRSSLTFGSPFWLQYTSSTGITMPQGSTLGFAANESGRFYVYEGTDGTDTDMGVIRQAIVPEDSLFSSAAISASATSATTLYSSSARTNWVWRCVGYIEATMSGTLGNWASIQKLQPMGPGIKRTGDIVQRVRAATGTYATGSTTIPIDNTTPQNTEGDQYMSQAITPTSAINKLFIRAFIASISNSTTGNMAMALFQDSVANAVKSSLGYCYNAQCPIQMAVEHTMLAGTTSSTTFKIRAGCNNAGTTYFNGTSLGALMNGTQESFIEIEEVFA